MVDMTWIISTFMSASGLDPWVRSTQRARARLVSPLTIASRAYTQVRNKSAKKLVEGVFV
jgi:hypothetical protein